MPKQLLLKHKDLSQNQYFEIDELEQDIFVIKTKNQIVKLCKFQKEWIQNHFELDEDEYIDLLKKRPSEKLEVEVSLSDLDSTELFSKNEKISLDKTKISSNSFFGN